MRIISGLFKSRIIKDTKSKRTHPMSEKIRGAMFNSIGDISGNTFLDAFAGTGAVGIEALSRGASHVNAVEIMSDSFETLKGNRDLVTDSEHMEVHRANIKTWLKNQDRYFDIVMADPPYDAVSMNALDVVAAYVEVGGLLILSLPQAEHARFKNFKKIDEKRYGNAKLVFYRRSK
ncbi:MAG: 16S rRNA (guanine966-N2)-methyltransferase [Candidatus Saccharimonadales bacterium]|jgi:16S rRNA (guanine966-N2)-methyltransferase